MTVRLVAIAFLDSFFYGLGLYLTYRVRGAKRIGFILGVGVASFLLDLYWPGRFLTQTPLRIVVGAFIIGLALGKGMTWINQRLKR